MGLQMQNVKRANNMSENKNPYEVRLDILKLANDILKNGNQIEVSGSHVPVQYNTDDVVSSARTLYDFVNTNKSQR